jgi:hypothetical protein
MASKNDLVDGKEYMGVPVDPEFGPNPKDQKPEIRLMMEITEGPLKGVRVPYKANLKKEAIKYAKRDLKAVGWDGKSIATFAADVKAAAGVPVGFVARLASFTRLDGTISEWWTVGSIGVAQVPLAKADDVMISNVDSWFTEDEEESAAAAPRANHDDVPF